MPPRTKVFYDKGRAADADVAAYLNAIREEVREGTGIFSEDDDLRSILQECFDRGDPSTGTVMWNDDWPECW
jgi:hypothetical protein